MDGFGPNFAFWVLAAITLLSGAGVFVLRDLFRAVLSLILSFAGIGGFFVLLSADFLGMAQIVIYVGAIAVLVLFAVFLTPYAIRRNTETVIAAPAIIASAVFAGFSVFVIAETDWMTMSDTSQAPAGFESTASALGDALLNPWVLSFQLASVLLTAALIGAIMIVRSQQEEEREVSE